MKKLSCTGEEREKNGEEVFACARDFLSHTRNRERKSGTKEKKEEDEWGDVKVSPLCAPEKWGRGSMRDDEKEREGERKMREMRERAQRRRSEGEKWVANEIMSLPYIISSPSEGERQEMEAKGEGRMKKAEAQRQKRGRHVGEEDRGVTIEKKKISVTRAQESKRSRRERESRKRGRRGSQEGGEREERKE